MERVKLLPSSTRRLLSIGIIMALVVALPLFIWAIVTGNFNLGEKAVSGEPIPTETPILYPTTTPLSTYMPYPTATATPYGSPTPLPTTSPTPQPQVLNFLIKFAGVAEGSADGAGVSATFQSQDGSYVTPPMTSHYIANGIYRISFIPSNPFPNVTFNGQQQIALKYLISLKGEKHLKTKFCSNTGVITRCNQTASFNDGMFIDAAGGTYDFTAFPLEPGDLYPQDGIANGADFTKIKDLLNKPCSSLTATDKKTADLDYNGCVNVRDAFLMRQTLQTRYDEN